MKINTNNIDWNRKEDISAEEVKATKGLEHLTDEQAEGLVAFIKTYCQLINNIHQQEKAGELDASHQPSVISLNPEPFKQAA